MRLHANHWAHNGASTQKFLHLNHSLVWFAGGLSIFNDFYNIFHVHLHLYIQCLGINIKNQTNLQQVREKLSELFLPLPSLLCGLRFLLSTFKINTSELNPGSHVGSSAVTRAEDYKRGKGVLMNHKVGIWKMFIQWVTKNIYPT